MFDDILGEREEKKKQYLGEKKAEAIISGDDMSPKKNPIPPSIGGLKGRPIGNMPTPTEPEEEDELELDFDFDDPDDDCCGEDCDCDTGCLKDEDDDLWSAVNAPHIG